MFAGSLKSLDCGGRVEIKTAAQTILCDRGVLDMFRKTFVMEMRNPKDDVRVYMNEGLAGGGGPMLLLAPKSLTVNMTTGEFKAGGPQHMESFTGPIPSNRQAGTPRTWPGQRQAQGRDKTKRIVDLRACGELTVHRKFARDLQATTPWHAWRRLRYDRDRVE